MGFSLKGLLLPLYLISSTPDYPPETAKTNVSSGLCGQKSLDELISDFSEPLNEDEKNKLQMIMLLDEYIRDNFEMNKGTSFCTVSNNKEDRTYALYVSEKTNISFQSDNLPSSFFIGSKERIDELAKDYSLDKFDNVIYQVYTPYSQINRSFLNQSYDDIADTFIHERFHDEVNFPRVIEEAMSNFVSSLVSIKFFEDNEFWSYANDAIGKFDNRLNRADIITRTYNHLNKLYKRKDISDDHKLNLRQNYFKHLEKITGDKNINNATILSEMYYMKNFRNLYDFHNFFGGNIKNSVRLFIVSSKIVNPIN